MTKDTITGDIYITRIFKHLVLNGIYVKISEVMGKDTNYKQYNDAELQMFKIGYLIRIDGGVELSNDFKTLKHPSTMQLCKKNPKFMDKLLNIAAQMYKDDLLKIQMTEDEAAAYIKENPQAIDIVKKFEELNNRPLPMDVKRKYKHCIIKKIRQKMTDCYIEKNH